MDTDLTAAAGNRLDAVLADAAMADPRPHYRAHLRSLRERDPEAFDRAVKLFEDELLPRAADPASDALAEWLGYGVRLAEITGSGRSVAIDQEGRATDAAERTTSDRLVLYMPDETAAPVLPLAVPAAMTAPQQATFDLLVAGRTA